MKPVGVVRFLGSNCDLDVAEALKELNIPTEFVWWNDSLDYTRYRGFVLPGGFSYGDYLRCGALAAHTPCMDGVRKAAQNGYPILGICNGFQILCEAALLPGALTKNESRKFQDQWVTVTDRSQREYLLPIAHSMGRYFATTEILKDIEGSGQVWMRYKINPNGSFENIAGVTDKNKKVFGLMPHPERAMHDWMGSDSGRLVFEELFL